MRLLLIIVTTAFPLAGRRPERPQFFLRFLGVSVASKSALFFAQFFFEDPGGFCCILRFLGVSVVSKARYFLSHVVLPYYHHHRVSLGREKAGALAIFLLGFLLVSVAFESALLVE